MAPCSHWEFRDQDQGLHQGRPTGQNRIQKPFLTWISTPFQVKFIDKLSFMFGVTCIVLTEFLALREPQWFTMVTLSFLFYPLIFRLITIDPTFPQFHMTLMALLLAYRLQDYQAQKYHLFMLDFCYFMNLSVIIQTSLYPDDLLWFKVSPCPPHPLVD